MTTLTGHGVGSLRLLVRKEFEAKDRLRMVREIEKMQRLAGIAAESGTFRVPAIVDVGRLHYTMEHVDGDPPSGDPQAVIKRAVHVLLAICGGARVECTPDNLWKVIIGKFLAVPSTDDDYLALVARLKKPRWLSAGYAHGDLTFDNILVDRLGQWWLIDPAWSEVEAPLWDIGKLLQSTAANWENIKQTGSVGVKSPWLEAVNNRLIDCLVDYFFPEDMLLGLACQLARVARWCHTAELIRIVKQLLAVYLKGNDREYLDALRRIE